MKTTVRFAVVLGVAMLLGACAQRELAVVASVPDPYAGDDGRVWSSAALGFEWPSDRAPAFHLDLLISHRIIAPAIAAHRSDIALWRVHRRAARDVAGHRLSLFVYARPEAGDAVLDAVARHPLVRRLQEHGALRSIEFGRPAQSRRPERADTSDRTWSPALQRAWPYFIMGVSETWVALIGEHVPEPATAGSHESVDSMIERYRAGAERISELWRDEGGHAFFHHLSALFGYEPLLLRF
ncbi:MAG: hypothetical protein ACR2RL_01725 [Gammaproteobacteria bacterium]